MTRNSLPLRGRLAQDHEHQWNDGSYIYIYPALSLTAITRRAAKVWR